MKRQLLFTFLFILGLAGTSNAQLISVGVGLDQSIDILQAPRQNTAILYNVTGNGFTAYPTLNVNIKDEMSLSILAGAGLSFMSKNNGSGEVDRDVLFTFPVGARLNFGSASNTGKDCNTWGWYVGAGRQWRTAIQIHSAITEPYQVTYAEIGGTVNANSPLAIGAYTRFGLDANQHYALQLGLSFTFSKVDDTCK